MDRWINWGGTRMRRMNKDETKYIRDVDAWKGRENYGIFKRTGGCNDCSLRKEQMELSV